MDVWVEWVAGITPNSWRLDARYCQRGWPDFVQHGARYSRPPQQREERLRRMRLAIAAEDVGGWVVGIFSNRKWIFPGRNGVKSRFNNILTEQDIC